jgi:hypothetical protein
MKAVLYPYFLTLYVNTEAQRIMNKKNRPPEKKSNDLPIINYQLSHNNQSINGNIFIHVFTSY